MEEHNHTTFRTSIDFTCLTKSKLFITNKRFQFVLQVLDAIELKPDVFFEYTHLERCNPGNISEKGLGRLYEYWNIFDTIWFDIWLKRLPRNKSVQRWVLFKSHCFCLMGGQFSQHYLLSYSLLFIFCMQSYNKKKQSVILFSLVRT